MSENPVVDVHTHLAPAMTSNLAEIPGLKWVEGRFVLDDQQVGLSSLYDAGKLGDWMASRGIDEAWVSVPPPFFRQGRGPQVTARWVAALNDGLLDRVAVQSSLTPLAYLPLDEPEVALAEIVRLRAFPRFGGWVGSAGGGSMRLDHPRVAPMWDALEALGKPVLLHPGSSPDARLDHHYLSNLLGNPVETTVAAAELVFGDVLGQRPELRIVLVHCGGVVPALAGRWQQGVDSGRPGIIPLKLEPRDAVKKLWVDALSHEPAMVGLALAVLGEDKVVLGSDWPFPMGLDHPVRALEHLSDEIQARITRDNVVALAGATP